MDELLNSIAARAASNFRVNEGDYQKDGLYYCGVCHKAKQKRFVNGRIVACICACEEEKDRRKAELMAREQRAAEISRLRSAGFPASEMQRYTFDRDDGSNPELGMVSRKYVENFQAFKAKGKGLLFFGDVGTGKTFMAACIANALIDQGHTVYMTNFARLATTLQSMRDGKQDFLDKLNRVELLILDDLASERNTEYMAEIVESVIDARYRSKRPVVVTTNLTAEDIKNPVGIRERRLYDRLREMTHPYEVKGQSKRKAIMRNDWNEDLALLGLKAGRP